MIRSPETENDGRRVEEEEENKDRNRSGIFISGFLAGLLAALICIAAVLAGWIAIRELRMGGGASGETADDGASVLTESETLYKLTEIQHLMEEYYLDDVDGSVLSTYLFKGLAAGLQDDYAAYYTVEELQSAMDTNRGEYYGVGAVLTVDEEKNIVVVTIYEDSPASRAGLAEGDILLSLDGESLQGMNLSEAVSLIKGREGAFALEIYRPETEEMLEFSMECGEVEIENVTWEMKEHHVGYIQITEFADSAVDQFTEAVEELERLGMERLIVDLRNNPGGLLTSVCDILDQILPEGLIVYTEDKNGNREEYTSDADCLEGCEIAVLVNGYSASASEIFAGAVQDYGLGPVVGAQTYGKGVVQKTYTLSDGSAFKMTVEKYYTPKGQDIDGNGITPDVIVEDKDEAQNTDPGGAETEPGDETEEGDPVLEQAMELLTGQES